MSSPLKKCPNKNSNHNRIHEQGNTGSPNQEDESFEFDPSCVTSSSLIGNPDLALTSNGLISESESSDLIDVSVGCRIFEPIELIATELKKIQKLEEELKLGNNRSLSKRLEKIRAGVKHGVDNFICEVERMTESSSRKTDHKSKPEDLSHVFTLQKNLSLQKEENISLDKENQELHEHKDQLEKKNKELLTTNDQLVADLARKTEECRTLMKILEEDRSKMAQEVELLKQKLNKLNNEYKHISESEEAKKETKDLGIQVQVKNIGTLQEQERAELDDKYRKKINHLEGELDKANERYEQSTSENSSLKERVKQLEEDLRLKAFQPNSTEKTLFDEIKEADQQKIETLDKSIQMEFKHGCNSETTVPIKNEELSSATQDFTKKTSKLTRPTEKPKGKKAQLAEKEKTLDIVQKSLTDKDIKVTQLTSETDKFNATIWTLNTQLTEQKEALGSANQEVTRLKGIEDQLKSTIEELEGIKNQLTEKEQELNSTEQDSAEKAGKVTQLTEENSQLKNELKLKKLENDYLKTKLQKSESKSKGLEGRVKNLQKQLESKNRLEGQVQGLQKQFESKNKELNGKKEKFLGASTYSKRQGNYVSISFVLSGAFAVGASLTIPYLAVCITLAIAALASLAVGLYCSYKANTALKDVEVDQVLKDPEYVVSQNSV